MTLHATAFLTASDDEDQGGWITRMLHRIRAEYEEMPGLCLTSAQAARLLGLEQHECAALLKGLVDVGFLRHTSAGYIRA